MVRVLRVPWALVALAVLAVGARRAAADERPTRVGVVAAVAVKVAPEDVQSLVGAFQRGIAETYLVEVVASPSTSPPATCASDTACLVDLSNRLGADRVVFLVLTGVGRKLRIDVTLAEPDRHVTHAPAIIVELGAPDLDKRLADYTHSLLPDVPLRPAPNLHPAAPASPDTAPTGVVALHAGGAPEQAPRRHDRAAWISFGAAAVLLTGGLVAGHYASSAYDEYKMTTSAARYDTLRQRVSRDATIANGMFIAGGAAAAVGAGLLLFRF